ncbi:MAG: flagellar protein FlaG [Spirochaetes bacterium]|nr:flagellar protein FlaG [Spirochaetota bacterium]
MDISKVSGNMPLTAFKVKQPEAKVEERKYEEPRFSRENLYDAVEMLNAAAKTANNRIAFSVDEKTDRIVMRVLDANNNEVIREIPPKEVIRLAAQIREMIGMFIDESR